MENFENIIQTYQQKINTSTIVEIHDIPNIDLYIDQVTTFIDDVLQPYKRCDDSKILTKTMVNNYTKAKVFPPPIKKKYGKMHIMLLIMLFHLKSVLSIKDIATLFEPIFTTAAKSQSETEKQIEQLYQGFIDLQKITRSSMSSTKLSVNITEQHNIFSAYPEYMKKILFVLLLSIRANMEKQLAEHILDLYFTKPQK